MILSLPSGPPHVHPEGKTKTCAKSPVKGLSVQSSPRFSVLTASYQRDASGQDTDCLTEVVNLGQHWSPVTLKRTASECSSPGLRSETSATFDGTFDELFSLASWMQPRTFGGPVKRGRLSWWWPLDVISNSNLRAHSLPSSTLQVPHIPSRSTAQTWQGKVMVGQRRP